MPLNKFAGFGSVAARPVAPGLGQRLTGGFANMTKAKVAVDDSASGSRGSAARPPTPSSFAFRLLARLSQVRDALCDLKLSKGGNAGIANGKLHSEREAKETKALTQELSDKGYEKLITPFTNQFRPLENDAELASEERRQRLAELAGFEWMVMETVEDPANKPAEVSDNSSAA